MQKSERCCSKAEWGLTFRCRAKKCETVKRGETISYLQPFYVYRNKYTCASLPAKEMCLGMNKEGKEEEARKGGG